MSISLSTTPSQNGGNTSQFTYGSDGLRRQATFNGTTTDYILDSSMMVRERQGGVNKATYFVGARGPEYRRDDSTGVVRWYVFDGLGSVVGEIDASGNVTSSRKLDVYGAVRGGTNSGGTSKQKFVGSLGHTSDDETGLVYMRARHYDPNTGRFESEDSAKDGLNWFVYCRSNPVNAVDSNGKEVHKTWDITALTGILLAIGKIWDIARANAFFMPLFVGWLQGFAIQAFGFIVGKFDSIGADVFGQFMTVTGVAGSIGSLAMNFSIFSQIEKFGEGYSMMLVATLLLLAVEVDISTGGL